MLVTGPTGSGKSTTLAAMIDYINRNKKSHIVTLEDPIEFVHQSQGCLINQREVGGHTKSFGRALRAALREDPDIVLVGEMRDPETIMLALETANTGHLVFGTLHTNNAVSAVDRVVDNFPADQQSQVRSVLSDVLQGRRGADAGQEEGRRAHGRPRGAGGDGRRRQPHPRAEDRPASRRSCRPARGSA